MCLTCQSFANHFLHLREHSHRKSAAGARRVEGESDDVIVVPSPSSQCHVHCFPAILQSRRASHFFPVWHHRLLGLSSRLWKARTVAAGAATRAGLLRHLMIAVSRSGSSSKTAGLICVILLQHLQPTSFLLHHFYFTSTLLHYFCPY